MKQHPEQAHMVEMIANTTPIAAVTEMLRQAFRPENVWEESEARYYRVTARNGAGDMVVEMVAYQDPTTGERDGRIFLLHGEEEVLNALVAGRSVVLTFNGDQKPDPRYGPAMTEHKCFVELA